MKKVIIAIVGVFVVVIGALVLVPVFYSVDDLRPKIQDAIQKQVRGKVELGKLSLRLFPDVRLHIDGLTATPSEAPFNQAPLATVGAVSVRMPLISFLTGPRATIVVDKPEILMVSKGTLSNLSAFLPAPTPETANPADKNAGTKAASKGLDESLNSLPGWLGSRVRAARMSIEVNDGNAVVRNLLDPSKGDKTEVHNLNVSLSDIGLDAPIAIKSELTADVVSGDMQISGPVKTEGHVTASPVAAGMKVTLDLDEDLTGLDAKMSTLFHKKAGVALTVGVKGTVDQGAAVAANMQDIEFRFGGFKMKGSLNLTDAADPDKAYVKAAFKSGETNIAPFGAIIPLVADYKLDGKFGLAVSASGPMMDPAVDVEVTLDNVSGATPQLKKPLSALTGKIIVKGTAKNPSVVIDPLSLRIASSDMSLKVETKGIENISANVVVHSKRLNADELLGLQALTVGEPGAKAAPAAPKNAPVVPLDETLNAMAPMIEKELENPMLDKISATVLLDMKSIKALGAEFNNATLNLTYAKRSLKISKTGIGGYGGRVDLSGDMGLTPKAPSFNFKAGLNGVKLEQMTAAHAPAWKNMVSGTMNGDFSVSGRGIRKEQLNQNLGGGLKGDVKNGHLDMPVVKLISGVMSSIPKGLGDKAASATKGKDFKGDFKTLKIVSVIKGRNIDLQDLDIVYDATSVNLGDMRFQAKGSVTFDQMTDITGTAYLAPNLIPVAELKGPSGKVEIPLKFKGPMANPSPDIGYSMGILGPRLAKAAGGTLLKKVLGGGNSGGSAPKSLNDLKKKFGF